MRSVKTRFILVRHGQTRWNLEQRIQGHGDSPLTQLGLAQADAIGARLARESFDALVASDLGRARQTAERIARHTGHALVLDPRVRERNFGVGEGLTYEEIDRLHPGAFSRTREMDPDYVVPGGETRRQFHERVVVALEALAREHAGRRIAVVAHGGVLSAVYRMVRGIALEAPHVVPISNASYNAVVHAQGAWSIEAWDELDHLAEAVPFADG